jgi:excisionase family DNA binding protein
LGVGRKQPRAPLAPLYEWTPNPMTKAKPAAANAADDAVALARSLGLDRVTYSPEQAAEILSVSKRTLWRWVGAGKLPVVRYSERLIAVRAVDLARLIGKSR